MDEISSAEVERRFAEQMKPLEGKLNIPFDAEHSPAEIVAMTAGFVAITGAAATILGIEAGSPELAADGIIVVGFGGLGFIMAGAVKAVSYFRHK